MSDRGPILVVDDNDPVRYTRVRLLRKAGYEVLEAATGKEALEVLQLRKPRLVILDVNLPDMSGIDVCRTIKSAPHTSSVLVLQVSATAVEAWSRVEGLEAGADNYVVEPVPQEVFLASVKALVRISEAEEAVRASATEWQATFDALREGICLLDPEGKVRRCNRAFGELTRPGGMVPASLEEIPEPLGSCSRDVFRRMLQGGSRETCLTTLADSWIKATTDPVWDSGRIAGAVYTIEDVTEHKRAQEEREKLLERERVAREAAEAANRSKDDFLATLSHELRTPLQAMLGWLWVLRNGPLDESSSANALMTIERNARSQAQLIEDLLDISRIITGKLRLTMRPVRLETVVRAALESVKPAASVKGIEVITSFPPESDKVAGDAGRLQQVVWNLLANAVKFTPRGGKVQVMVERTSSMATIRVRDSGKGIPAQFLPFIFDRFRQADSSASRTQGGLGLGLAIVRHLVELHGGTVTGESEGEGKGATFTVSLLVPAVLPEEGGAEGEGSGRSHPTGRPRRMDGLRVLVLDDEEDARKLLAIVLEREGARVTTSGCAAEGIEAVRSEAPHVIVSDIGMPGEDGYSFIRRVRALGGGLRDVPALALTAYAREEERIRALAAGFQDHIPKPVTPPDLIEALLRLVGAAGDAN